MKSRAIKQDHTVESGCPCAPCQAAAVKREASAKRVAAGRIRPVVNVGDILTRRRTGNICWVTGFERERSVVLLTEDVDRFRQKDQQRVDILDLHRKFEPLRPAKTREMWIAEPDNADDEQPVCAKVQLYSTPTGKKLHGGPDRADEWRLPGGDKVSFKHESEHYMLGRIAFQTARDALLHARESIREDHDKITRQWAAIDRELKATARLNLSRC